MSRLASSSFFFCFSLVSFLGSYKYVEDESRVVSVVVSVVALVDVLDVEVKVVDDCPGILTLVVRHRLSTYCDCEGQ
ncbi:hypothetical protein F5Y08DRAFT_296644 [Xylaria arbuscula]|nr:hypothetical protein F5Y08DRAFT_296644 [Xylaria arbuscula]